MREITALLRAFSFAWQPAPVFSAGRLPACGSPAGAFEARRSVRSRKPLCKPIHSAAMRSNFRQPLIASLREAFKQRIKHSTSQQIFESLNKRTNVYFFFSS
jgi:hypothetical protein